MLALLELLGGLFGLFEFAEVTTRRENRTAVQTTMLLGGFALIAGLPAIDGNAVDPVTFAPLFAAQLAGAALLITLLHAVRPVGEDIPPRTWTDTYRRCVGPLLLLVLSGLFIAALTGGDDGAVQLFVAVTGGLGVLFAVASLLRAARNPF